MLPPGLMARKGKAARLRQQCAASRADFTCNFRNLHNPELTLRSALEPGNPKDFDTTGDFRWYLGHLSNHDPALFRIQKH